MFLSPAQAAIVNAPIGNILVMATAGSGKTRVLTERARFLLDRDPYSGVLALTFTNKAAQEMRDRLAGIPDVQSRCFVGTIHAFAQEIVERHGTHIGYASVPHLFERDEDRLRLIDEALQECQLVVAEESVRDSHPSDTKDRRRLLLDWLARISEYKRSHVDRIRAHSKYGAELLAVADAYQEHLAAQNAIDFDDLLSLAFRILNEVPEVAEHYARSYAHVCVDEAQDLNAIQYELLSVLCRGRDVTLMLVGDKNQAIYGFNGCSPEYMVKRFVAEFAPSEFSLTENYRSTQRVLKAAEALRPGSQDVGRAPLVGRLECRELPDEDAEAAWVCEKIDALIEEATHPEIEGRIGLERMVVVARNRYVLRSLEKRLSDEGRMWHVRHAPGAPKFESKLGQALDLTLRLVINSQDVLHAAALAELAGDELRLDEKVPALLGRLRLAPTSPEQSLVAGVIDAAQSMMRPEGEPQFEEVIDGLKARHVSAGVGSGDSDPEKESAAGDLEEWLRHWECYVKSCAMGAKVSIQGFRGAMAMGQTHPKSTKEGLALSTVHTMKGAESDIVFLIGLSDGTFPDYRAVKQELVEEERNSAFVAVTRARRWLYVSYPAMKRMPWGDEKPQAPSPFFTEIERTLAT